MGRLTASELLDVWERGLGRPLPERVLGLLAAAFGDTTVDQFADVPIGQRDALLLRLRERLFGREITVVARCPGCGEQIESTFAVDDVRFDLDQGEGTAGTHVAEIGGCRAVFRLPTTRDLLALTDTSSALDALVARCVLEARDANGDAVRLESLDEEMLATIASRMSETDPQADVELRLACSTCGHQWPAVFDIASFLWKELHAWALRTLREVHGLARSYGWREADVLALSATRRQLYLELSRP
jgi:hypothetical protein